jgi:flavin-dependent dehydrogenase
VIDALIVGAGPAGSAAAITLARAGARVRLIDRMRFPREKLCGDTVNPGAVAILRRLGVAAEVEARGLPVAGWLVTGEHGVSVEVRYPRGARGVAISRRDLDRILLRAAAAAGAEIEECVSARGAIVADGHVSGAVLAWADRRGEQRAGVTIAADGRGSALAFGLGLARYATRPRRWAIGVYLEGARVGPDIGRMHIRRNRYVGVAAIPGGLVRVCLVEPNPAWRDAAPERILLGALGTEAALAAELAGARVIGRPSVLGPLAVDAAGMAIDGLLIAGDAAGFVDPMTGDGLRFALRGGELAAEAALEALASGWNGVHARLSARRGREFGGKRRFDRAVRGLVSSPWLISAAAVGARVAPGILRAVVARAGDCAAAS